MPAVLHRGSQVGRMLVLAPLRQPSRRQQPAPARAVPGCRSARRPRSPWRRAGADARDPGPGPHRACLAGPGPARGRHASLQERLAVWPWLRHAPRCCARCWWQSSLGSESGPLDLAGPCKLRLGCCWRSARSLTRRVLRPARARTASRCRRDQQRAFNVPAAQCGTAHHTYDRMMESRVSHMG